jgi:hypothetical protein
MLGMLGIHALAVHLPVPLCCLELNLILCRVLCCAVLCPVLCYAGGGIGGHFLGSFGNLLMPELSGGADEEMRPRGAGSTAVSMQLHGTSPSESSTVARTCLLRVCLVLPLMLQRELQLSAVLGPAFCCSGIRQDAHTHTPEAGDGTCVSTDCTHVVAMLIFLCRMCWLCMC